MLHPASRLRLAAAASFAAALLFAGDARGEEQRVVFRLNSGAEVSGVILDDGFDDARGITLRRDDNGGRLSLAWEQIRPADAVEIKRLYGYESDEPPAMSLRAIKVTVTGGKSITGLPGGEDAQTVRVVRRGNVTPVPRGNIVRIENVSVDALEVENPPEAFERARREANVDSAIEWYNLGLIAEALTLYEQAKECFARALEIDPRFSRKDAIERRQKILDAKLKETDAAEMLRRIRTLRVHGEFEPALLLVDEFASKWSGSLLYSEVQKEQKRLAVLHRDDLLAQVRTQFFTVVREICEAKALDQEIFLGAALSFAKEDLFGVAVERLGQKLSLDAATVKMLFAERGNKGSATAASYGPGTFVLGPDDARKDLYKKRTTSGGAVAGSDGKVAEDAKPLGLAEEIQKKIKERQEAAAKRDAQKGGVSGNAPLADVPPTPDEWWVQAQIKERTAFLMAFFAEYSECGVIIERLTTRDCTMCGGKGKLEFIKTGSTSASNNTSGRPGEFDIPCSRCKSLTFDRIVHFK
jgi:tetratricopeptide (TPR) repeat protein